MEKEAEEIIKEIKTAENRDKNWVENINKRIQKLIKSNYNGELREELEYYWEFYYMLELAYNEKNS